MADIKQPLEILRVVPDTKAQEVSESQAKLRYHHDREWNLASQDFWFFFKFVRTVDEDSQQIRDMTPFPYLKELDYEIESHQKTIILKSRRMLVSWLGVLRHLHCAMFAGTFATDAPETFRGGLMTIGETEAKYLIERTSGVWHRLPEWMKERNQLTKDNEIFLSWEKGGTIQAFPLKREGPQSFGFSRVLFDEMALQDAVRSVWAGMMPTLGAKGKLLAVSTPNGKTNLFYDVWHNKDNRFGGIHRRKLHWTDNPEHDQKWFDAVTTGMDKPMIDRMFELSFAVYAGQPVWNEFQRRMHVTKETFILPRPMLIGWDFGYHFPAATFWQYNTSSQYVGHREKSGFDVGFDVFCKSVLEFANTFCNPRQTGVIHFIDPAGFQRYHSRSSSGAVSDAHELRHVWGKDAQIRPGAIDVGTRSNEGARLKAVRKLWKLRADGRPGIIINEAMTSFIEGCAGGYAYPEKQSDSETPDKGDASHLQDTFQYLVTGYEKVLGPTRGQKPTQKTPERIGHRTGL